MPRLRPLLAALALGIAPLAGCATVPAPLPADAAAVSTIPAISGEWDIASFEGVALDRRAWDGTRLTHMDFTADGDLSAQLACNSLSTRVVVRDGRLYDAPDATGIITAAGCRPKHRFNDQDLLDFLDTNPAIHRLPDGTTRLDGGGSVMVLERPEAWRLHHGRPIADLVGEWRVAKLSTGRFQDAYFLDGEDGMRVRIAPDSLTLAKCAAMAVPVTYTDDFRFDSRVSGATRTDPTGCAPTDDETAIRRIFQASPAATMTREGTLVLTGGGMSVALVRPADWTRLFPDD